MENISGLKGLSEFDAALRLKKEGFNELPSQKSQSIFSILFNVLREPMLILLLIAGFLYIILGEQKDALMLLTFVLVVIGITFWQERKTERALEALRNLSSPRALVIRDGNQKRIPGRNVVREDILILREGDRVPADSTILFSANLSVDESLLTGESLAVNKYENDIVFSGTLVVQGHGAARVEKIGEKTEMGKIGKALETIAEEDTLVKKEIGKIVKNFAIAGVSISLLIVLFYGLTRGNWLNGFLAGLTLSMSLLPEEFPVVLIIFFTLGAWRISKSNVLTRKTTAIETLGAATVLCVDKTGTITLNSMKLISLFSNNEYYYGNNDETPLHENFHNLLEYALLASQKDPFDPIEKEVKRMGDTHLSNTEHIHNNWKLVQEYNLSKDLLALSHVWESPDKQNYIIASKGAPEAIANLCHFDDAQLKELEVHIDQLASRGLRLLGVAKATFDKGSLPKEQHEFNFEFIGLLGFIDPVRETVPESVVEAHDAGIRIIMITGDYPGTAVNIARQIGLRNPQAYLTGPQIEKLTLPELQKEIRTVNVFARVVPEQKLAIINALKANGEIVAMTGDGVNDAPALKAAHIGVAMGQRGTDVARESAALVLLDDNFSSIVKAVRLGRRIYDNLKKAIIYIFAVHVPIAGMSLLPVIFHLPLVLLPAHIAFLELIIDPACSTVFEADPEEKDIMKRPPRKLNSSLFDGRALLLSALQGLSILAIVFIIFLFALYLGKGEDDARTLAFASLVFANLVLILTNLSWHQNLAATLRSGNKAMIIVIVGAISALMSTIYVPFLRDLFHFTILHPKDLLIAVAGGGISLAWFEGLKIISFAPATKRRG